MFKKSRTLVDENRNIWVHSDDVIKFIKLYEEELTELRLLLAQASERKKRFDERKQLLCGD